MVTPRGQSAFSSGSCMQMLFILERMRPVERVAPGRVVQCWAQWMRGSLVLQQRKILIATCNRDEVGVKGDACWVQTGPDHICKSARNRATAVGTLARICSCGPPFSLGLATSGTLLAPVALHKRACQHGLPGEEESTLGLAHSWHPISATTLVAGAPLYGYSALCSGYPACFLRDMHVSHLRCVVRRVRALMKTWHDPWFPDATSHDSGPPLQRSLRWLCGECRQRLGLWCFPADPLTGATVTRPVQGRPKRAVGEVSKHAAGSNRHSDGNLSSGWLLFRYDMSKDNLKGSHPVVRGQP